LLTDGSIDVMAATAPALAALFGVLLTGLFGLRTATRAFRMRERREAYMRFVAELRMLDPRIPAWRADSPEVVKAMVATKLIGSKGMQQQVLRIERLISERPDPGYSLVSERQYGVSQAFKRWLIDWQANLDYLEDGARRDLRLRTVNDDWDRIAISYTITTAIWLTAIISIWLGEPGIAELHFILALIVTALLTPTTTVIDQDSSGLRGNVRSLLMTLYPFLAGAVVVAVALTLYPSTGLGQNLVLTLLALLTGIISARVSFIGFRGMWAYGVGRHGSLGKLWHS
jgi:hypothetical protein